MAVCRKCAADNPDESAYCGACGSPLAAITCPACRAVAPCGQAFCGSCGNPLGQDRPLATAVEERKLATVLFADVVGFTSLAERTDPEVVARIVDAAFREMAVVVADHGGTVDKYMGDSVMAVFGVPVAHDDDAARAVAAGLAMVRLGGDLAFSIGINSGEVMAAAVGEAGDLTVIGDTVNVAARLEKAAGPGQVLCGPITAELAAGRVILVPHKALVLKGKAQPVPAWEATGLRVPTRATAADNDVALVGRRDELEWLLRLWRRSADGDGAQVALLCGDAGVGKTRLLDELACAIGGDAVLVRASHPPFGPTGGERLAGEVLGQLGARPHADADPLAGVWSMAGKIGGSPVEADPGSMPEERLWKVVRLLERRAADGPIAVLLDDLHHAHDTVLDFLAALAGRLTRLPVLLVLAGRSEPAGWLAHFPAATTVRLDPLSARDAATLADSLIPGPPLDERSQAMLVERSAGNPLHLRELTRLAATSGALIVDGDHTRLELGATVPASLHALLGARLDALGPARKAIVQRVAVLGPGASTALVEALGPGAGEVAVADLVASRVLGRVSGGFLELVDPLLREVAYEALPQRVRADLHRRAAAVMPGIDDQARHLGHAARYLPDDRELAAEAAAALTVLGRELAHAWRLPEARRTLERAVELGARGPEVLLELARLHEAASRPDAVTAVLSLLDEWPGTLAIERDHTEARALTWSDPLVARDALLDVGDRWAIAGNQVKAAWAWANAGVASFYLGEMRPAASSLERALTVFEREDDRGGAVAAESFLCLVHPGDPRVAGWLVDTLEFADSTGDRSMQLSALVTLTWHHFVGSLLGTATEAEPVERFGSRLVALASDLEAAASELQGRCLLALTARLTGQFPVAAAQLVEINRLADHLEPTLVGAVRFVVASVTDPGVAPGFDPPETHDPAIGIACAVVATALSIAGRPTEALAWLGASAAGGRGSGHVGAVVGGLALVLAGRTDDARDHVERTGDGSATLGSRPLDRAVAGLRAALGADGVAPQWTGSEPSVADALVLRARSLSGDPTAAGRLESIARDLAAPGLLLGR